MTYVLLKLSRHIFFVFLTSILFFSFSLAYLTSVILGFFLYSNVESSVEVTKFRNPISFPMPEKKPFEEYEKTLTGNIFQLSLRGGTEENIALESKEIELIGVIAGSKEFARALVRVKDDKSINEYAIGEIVGGNKILNIFYNSILVLKGNREIEIFVGEDSTQSKEKSEIDKTEEKISSNIQKVSIKRSKVIQLTQNQAQLYENKFTPITKDGKILGIKMIFIPNNNFLYELGARSGDIIRRINGQPLDNMNKMMELWQSIQTLNKISVEIERSGKILPFEIMIQD
ncbi:MAG: hypothetical protein ACK4UJ_01360 [Leptonema sp. (in: bacteria)]